MQRSKQEICKVQKYTQQYNIVGLWLTPQTVAGISEHICLLDFSLSFPCILFFWFRAVD